MAIFGMCLRSGMIMDLAAVMHVLRLEMNMNHSGDVILVRQTSSRSVGAGPRKGDRRRQYAKQIGKGYQPPCPQSLPSGQPDEHRDNQRLFFAPRLGSIAVKIGAAKMELLVSLIGPPGR